MPNYESSAKEEIKNRIDKLEDNYIDSGEIINFIFDEENGEKNLIDLGNYLNNLSFYDSDEIKDGVNIYFNSSERINTYKNISEKIEKNQLLDEKELSLMYLKMIFDEKFKGYSPSFRQNYFTFNSNLPIDKINDGTLINYIRNEYNNQEYLSNNSNEIKSNDGLSNENNQPTIRPATKEEISLIPQSIKNFFSTGCEYLVKGKDYIVKKASGAIETVGEFVGGIVRTFVDFSKIKSSPSEKNPKTGITQCSKTAQKNAKNFGINIPNGNAKEGVYKSIIDEEHFISSYTKLENHNTCIDIYSCPEYANFADISIESDTINGRKYGHRATAFKNNDGQRYVLDPYYSGGYNTKPIPWDKYPKHTRAEKINFYNAPKQSKST